MGTTGRIGWMVASLALAPAAWAQTPDAAVRAYLKAGTRQDTEAIQALVVSACWETPTGRAAPVLVLGVPLQLSEVEVSTLREDGDQATVQYAVVGSVRAEETSTALDAFGIQGEIQVQDLSVASFRRMGTLPLVREDGRWQITCAADQGPATAPPPAPTPAPPEAPPTTVPPGG